MGRQRGRGRRAPAAHPNPRRFARKGWDRKSPDEAERSPTMRRQAFRAAIYSLVVTLATPATVAFAAGPGDDRSKGAPPVVAPSVVIAVTRSSQPTSLGSRREWRDEVARATAAVVKQTGRVGVSKPVTRGIRKQGGTGRWSPCWFRRWSVSRATVYMLRYMKDQQNADEPDVGNSQVVGPSKLCLTGRSFHGAPSRSIGNHAPASRVAVGKPRGVRSVDAARLRRAAHARVAPALARMAARTGCRRRSS